MKGELILCVEMWAKCRSKNLTFNSRALLKHLRSFDAFSIKHSSKK